MLPVSPVLGQECSRQSGHCLQSTIHPGVISGYQGITLGPCPLSQRVHALTDDLVTTIEHAPCRGTNLIQQGLAIMDYLLDPTCQGIHSLLDIGAVTGLGECCGELVHGDRADIGQHPIQRVPALEHRLGHRHLGQDIPEGFMDCRQSQEHRQDGGPTLLINVGLGVADDDAIHSLSTVECQVVILIGLGDAGWYEHF